MPAVEQLALDMPLLTVTEPAPEPRTYWENHGREH